MRLPSIKNLTYLLALHEHQNFNRAAKACNVSQSTLSSGIQNLEESLGSQLIERDNKSFMFTALGQEAVLRARDIVNHTRDLVEYVQNQASPMSGEIRLGCIPTIAPFLLSTLVTEVNDQYPQLRLLLREDTTANLLRLLEQGDLDLLILALPMDTKGFHTMTVGRDPFSLVMHRELQQRYGEVPDLLKMPERSVFLLEREHCLTGHAVSACRLTDSTRINPFAATSLHTLVQMVNAKLGSTFLPQLAIEAGILTGTELVALPMAEPDAYREIGLVWRQTSSRIQTYRRLGELVSALMPEPVL
ncbi:LysR substrate-binding domain-containing protein [Gallaecimonas sp. GXIMD4217]|uniref:hydrogen peroxide-inducible genes activator n=1 Tax=Gallaecimonas sp. GXIMD4217 TaxID=3131927 RepID=UPI00311B07C1